MVRGVSTKPVRIGSDKIYFTKARDFLKGAIVEAEKENWNSQQFSQSMPSLVHAMRFVPDFYSYDMVEWIICRQ